MGVEKNMLSNSCGTVQVPVVNVKLFFFFLTYLILKLNIELFSEFLLVFVEKLGSGPRGQLIMDPVRSATLVLLNK